MLRQWCEMHNLQGADRILLLKHVSSTMLPINAAILGPFQVNPEVNVCEQLPKDSIDSRLGWLQLAENTLWK